MEKKNKSDEIKPASAKWLGIVGFLIAIVLLAIAVFLSINQEQNERLSKLNEIKEQKQAETASSMLSKNINEVKANEILGTASVDNNSVNGLSNSANGLAEVSSSAKVTENNNNNNSKNNTNSTLNENNNESTDLLSQNQLSKKENEDLNGDTKEKTNSSNENASSNEKKEKSNTKRDDEKNKSLDDNATQFVKPASGETTNEYSMDSLIYSNTLEEWVTHRGVDIKGEQESDIVSIAEGTITSIKNDPRYGLSVTIEHNDGFKSIYSCLLATEDGIEEGMKISQGQVIGKMGNSGVFESGEGAHLHFELMQNGDYINPELYIK